VFHWRTDAESVEMNDNISLPEYTITNVSHLVCTKNFSSTGQSRQIFVARYWLISPCRYHSMGELQEMNHLDMHITCSSC